jgi:hypothetical protein
MKNDLFENVIKLGLMAAVICVACPDAALAQKLSSSVTEIKQGISNIPTLVSGFAYFAGAATILSGAGMLKKHSENPQQNPLAPGVTRLALGAAVAALPSMISFMAQSIGRGDGDQTYRGLGVIN